jgi:hypothetical protein
MKCCVDSIIKMVDCLRRKELLYQKAFIRRCQNLQNAEAEVCSIVTYRYSFQSIFFLCYTMNVLQKSFNFVSLDSKMYLI